jgi:hypothetical protein
MANQGDHLPVLIVDGARFSDFDGFVREFSRLLGNYTWRGNLDAFQRPAPRGFRDARERMGAEVAQLRVVSARARATTQRLERLLLTCHPSNRSAIEARISSSRRCEGPTLFDEIIEIIRDHGPGGSESEDGILLELV